MSNDWIVSIRIAPRLIREGSLVLVDTGAWPRGRLHAPDRTSSSQVVVKRVLGRPGRCVSRRYLEGSAGFVQEGRETANNDSLGKVPDRHLVVAGDRGVGFDSSVFGPVPFAAVTHLVLWHIRPRTD